MKDNKKERRVDNLDIKAFVKKVFQESSWLMAKLAASPEDEGECFVDMARSISIKRLNELYGDLVDDRIVERLNNEIDEFGTKFKIDDSLLPPRDYFSIECINSDLNLGDRNITSIKDVK